MLTNTFCHIPGIGEKTEQDLWAAGVLSWGAATGQPLRQIPRSRQGSLARHIEESVCHYDKRNANYFAENLPSNQDWRLYRDFQDSCAFVDIETTGLYLAKITTIVLYDGQTIRHYVQGENLDHFLADVSAYRLLVTYNGKSFDVPFIESHFHVRLPQAHIDLRYPLRSLGLKGGLKGCERQMGIGRPGLESIDGFIAPLLWYDYLNRENIKALETLLAYNIQDTLSLHTLMVHAYNQKVQATPFAGTHSLPVPSLPRSPFQPDTETVERVRRQLFTPAGVFTTTPLSIKLNSKENGVS
jgi:uncharacterized protein YprB with RNaseH-like and TPR domain